MPFALYERPCDDAPFLFIDGFDSFDRTDELLRERRKQRIESGKGPIKESRIVAAAEYEDLPMHGDEDELSEIIREHRSMYPSPY
jgi:hypothetical protein